VLSQSSGDGKVRQEGEVMRCGDIYYGISRTSDLIFYGEPVSSLRGLGSVQKRVVDQGIFCSTQKLNFYLEFDMYPAWLLCVNKVSCRNLTIVGFSTEENMLKQIHKQGYGIKFLCKVLHDIGAACVVNYCGSGKYSILELQNITLLSSSSPQQVCNKVHECKAYKVLGCLEIILLPDCVMKSPVGSTPVWFLMDVGIELDIVWLGVQLSL
jgi:hypothetical protein